MHKKRKKSWLTFLTNKTMQPTKLFGKAAKKFRMHFFPFIPIIMFPFRNEILLNFPNKMKYQTTDVPRPSAGAQAQDPNCWYEVERNSIEPNRITEIMWNNKSFTKIWHFDGITEYNTILLFAQNFYFYILQFTQNKRWAFILNLFIELFRFFVCDQERTAFVVWLVELFDGWSLSGIDCFIVKYSGILPLIERQLGSMERQNSVKAQCQTWKPRELKGCNSNSSALHWPHGISISINIQTKTI